MTKVLLSALFLATLPGVALAMCPGKRDKVVSDCAAGELRSPTTGLCTKAVHS